MPGTTDRLARPVPRSTRRGPPVCSCDGGGVAVKRATAKEVESPKVISEVAEEEQSFDASEVGRELNVPRALLSRIEFRHVQLSLAGHTMGNWGGSEEDTNSPGRHAGVA